VRGVKTWVWRVSRSDGTGNELARHLRARDSKREAVCDQVRRVAASAPGSAPPHWFALDAFSAPQWD
jgi:hypothetical protein